MKNKKLDPFKIEEEYRKEDRREFKKEKKQAKYFDRSRYKKTDLKEKVSIESNKTSDIGRVISVSKELVEVFFENQSYHCTLRGSLKKDRTLLKNLIAVGDLVHFSKQSLTIDYVEERKSILSRMELLRQKEHILAVNIDLAFIVVSVVSPPLKPFIIDRFLISAKKGNIEPIILFNKVDLLKEDKKEEKLLQELISALHFAKYQTLEISTLENINLDLLKKLMKNRASVFVGQSGVGKSSLINVTCNLNLPIGYVLSKTLKGAHTTTKASLIPIKEGGFCIDTPGIKSFGIWEFSIKDLITHFEEFSPYSPFCKYPNCMHDEEPECEVKKALSEGKIPLLRFEAYHSLMKELKEKPTLKR